MEEMISVADWYTTFCGLAGVDPTDERAAAAGLPPVDGLDMWPLLSGDVTDSPRTEFLVSATALIQGKWKVMVGKQEGAGWAGPHYPNISTVEHAVADASITCEPACLFDVTSDPTEHQDVAKEHPEVVQALVARLDELKTAIVTKDMTTDPQCREAAFARYGGWYGPWLELD
uniref:Sulfatase N-terminal domain-containing protein n=1 Tax=Lotharella oceanica TaxID=641309 RepID=A0A7S2TR55_9EUKA